MIKISEEYRHKIIEHSMTSDGHEACGILAGKKGRVEKVYKMANMSDSPETCYFMDPKEQLKVLKSIRSEGLEILGIYHSHPSSEAYPSEKDVELAFYPEASYVIVSLHPSGKIQFKSYKIVGGKISEEEIEV